MSIAVQINDQIKQAMLAKDKDRLAALRDIKSKLLLEATSGGGSEVSDEAAVKICMKLYKQRMETYDLYVNQGRQDLAQEELVQAKVIEEFLPKQLSESEIQAEIQEAMVALGVEGPK
ncbi:MAG: GatB/YqeY domain-containing protein, partial [Flavobacteriia bacterium]|nr:GatB/YqeY domain-containing protein [Flavobacteriia bacterium]